MKMFLQTAVGAVFALVAVNAQAIPLGAGAQVEFHGTFVKDVPTNTVTVSLG